MEAGKRQRLLSARERPRARACFGVTSGRQPGEVPRGFLGPDPACKSVFWIAFSSRRAGASPRAWASPQGGGRARAEAVRGAGYLGRYPVRYSAGLRASQRPFSARVHGAALRCQHRREHALARDVRRASDAPARSVRSRTHPGPWRCNAAPGGAARSAQRVQKCDGARREAHLWCPGARCALSRVPASQALAQAGALRHDGVRYCYGPLAAAYARICVRLERI